MWNEECGIFIVWRPWAVSEKTSSGAWFRMKLLQVFSNCIEHHSSKSFSLSWCFDDDAWEGKQFAPVSPIGGDLESVQVVAFYLHHFHHHLHLLHLAEALIKSNIQKCFKVSIHKYINTGLLSYILRIPLT